MTVIAKQTNGTDSKIFRVTGPCATVFHVSQFGGVESEDMPTTEARKLFSFGRKLGWADGFSRLKAYRRLTTEAQFALFCRAEFDFDKYDNDAEAELAVSETFYGQGFLEVAA